MPFLPSMASIATRMRRCGVIRGCFNALVRMFEQALTVIDQLSAKQRSALIARLDRTSTIGHNPGYGVGDDMDSLSRRRRRLPSHWTDNRH